MNEDPQSLTMLLSSVNHGREGAFGEIIERVYADLRRVASHRMKGAFNRSDDELRALTVQPTEIVDDAIVVLMRQHAEWKNTEQFFAVATRLMLRVIGDYQRKRMAEKRGGGQRGGALHSDIRGSDDQGAEHQFIEEQAAIQMQGVMAELHQAHPRKAEVMTMHVISGLSQQRVAELLEVSVPTVERDLRFAKAWLKEHLED